MRYHLIAIGGSVMHNFAIDLKDMGHEITGSDDEIYEPSRSRLKSNGLLPEHIGWDADRIHENIDAVILGKHAREDNPELIKALSLELPIFSFPEFFSRHTSATRRVCIAGSHGKTTTTSMIMHVLQKEGFDFDYLVGANLDGFEKMVKISNADIMVVEGDEYPSSCLDDRAKMLHYNPDVAVITGVAWDHINIYKTYDSYIKVFSDFLNLMPEDSICYFDQNDDELLKMMVDGAHDCQKHAYLHFESDREGNIIFRSHKYPVQVFGKHNMSNLKAAYHVCSSLGIDDHKFFSAIKSFKGAAKRLEKLYEKDGVIVYRDFAHAPSKCKASCEAIRSKYSKSRIFGILELHTFSSLDQSFIDQYRNTMNSLDSGLVYFDPHALEMKKMPSLDIRTVHQSFNHPNLQIINSAEILKPRLLNTIEAYDVILIMSSGNLGGLDLDEIFN
ncbi:MAG: peptidoglycan synthetase [Bacteroidia bacterium]|nr:peptidoglycan synthetase [Bacteroidia bacterium]